MKKVVYYARVSTEEDKQLNALKNQVDILENFINNNADWKLICSYIDEGKSGTTTKNRKEYNKLFDDLSTNKFDIIVVKDQSRLNRNVLDYYKFIDKLVKSKKQLFFYTDNCFYRPDDTLINGIKALLSAEYSRDISKKVNAGNRNKQKQGRIYGNTLIWGYDKDKQGNFIINEHEAEIIRKIFNLYCEGNGFRKIYKKLEEQGIRNRNNKPFALTTLKRIIKNEKYKGVLVSNKTHKDFYTKKVEQTDIKDRIVIEGGIPAIVSKEIWNKANEILSTKKRRRKNKGNVVEYGYFKGSSTYANKIICGVCGKTYWHTNKKYYQCQEYRQFGLKKEGQEHGCVNIKILEKDLDNIMQNIIYKFIINKDKDVLNVFSILEKVLGDNANKDELNMLEKDKEKLNNKKDRLINMLMEELITKQEFKQQKEKIDKQLYIIEEKINNTTEEYKNTASKKDRLQKIKDYINNTVIKNKKDIGKDVIQTFLDKIIVKNENELEIILNGNIKYNAINHNNQYTIQRVTDSRYYWTQLDYRLLSNKNIKLNIYISI